MSYAIFRSGGQQFRAEEGRRIRVPLLEGQPGDKVTFDEVLLAGDGEKVKAGTPLVKGAKVQAQIVGEVKGSKVTVFKFKRRKNYRRKTGHRQKYTEVEIKSVKA